MARERRTEFRSPEEKTAGFFGQNVHGVGTDLLDANDGMGMVITLSGTNKAIRVVDIEEFEEVGIYYKNNIQTVQRGQLWNAAKRQIAQSLIATGGLTCIRLAEVEFYHPGQGRFVSEMENAEGKFIGTQEGDIAKYFGLTKNERSELKFVDDSDMLHIVRQNKPQVQEVTPAEKEAMKLAAKAEEANKKLLQYLEEVE